MAKDIKLSEDTGISMPLKNLISIVASVAIGVWAYFGVIERLNIVETNEKLISSDVEKNTEFRIKWPRGEMGSLPADSEQFMLIEDLYGSVEKIEKHIESMADNRINIDFLRKQVDKMMADIEKLKDADRDIVYKNGNGN